jgi:hypothetical protein
MILYDVVYHPTLVILVLPINLVGVHKVDAEILEAEWLVLFTSLQGNVVQVANFTKGTQEFGWGEECLLL